MVNETLKQPADTLIVRPSYDRLQSPEAARKSTRPDWATAESSADLSPHVLASSPGVADPTSSANFVTGPPTEGTRFLTSVSAMGRRCWQEIRETSRITGGQPVRVLRVGTGLWRRRYLRRVYSDAQLSLGQRMFAAGIDDGQMGAQIAALDKQIRQAEAAKVANKAFQTQRENLLRELAVLALAEEGSLPGADAEYQWAREAETTLRRHEDDLAATKTSLAPGDGAARRRVVIGFGAVSGFFILALLVMFR